MVINVHGRRHEQSMERQRILNPTAPGNTGATCHPLPGV